MDEHWRPARETNPPTVVDLSRVRGMTDERRNAEPITLRFSDRQFRVPPGTRYIRHGVSQEGFTVDYQDADGDWRGAEEIDLDH